MSATTTVCEAFRESIKLAQLTPPEAIITDGQIQRFSSNGERGDDAGWYVFHPDGVPAGSFGCHRAGIKHTWSSQSDATLTSAERDQQRARFDEARRQRDLDAKLRHADAAKRAQVIMDQARPAPADHPYLVRKQVQAHGLRLAGDSLIVPIYIDGAITSLQFIPPDGQEKKFLFGGAVKGGHFVLGELRDPTIVLTCEGFATGASLHEATGYPVAVAFSTGNIKPVAMTLRAQHPTAKILIAADNDVRDDGTPNTGVDAATAASQAIGGLLVVPELNGAKADFNDVACAQGPDAVRAMIETVLKPNASAVLDAVHVFLGRFVVYPSEHARVAHCLWVAHTHLMEVWESTPRLAFLSPEPGSGKTRALELTETLVPRPIEAINVSSAYFFRKISDPNGMPTMLHDEIDTIFGAKAKEHEEIRGVINAGHRRGASAGRCVVKGKQIETEELPAFCAVAMAGLGNLPPTILTRSVIIRMRRRAPGEQVEPYRRRLHAPEGYALRDRLAVWANEIRETLDTYPAMPPGITDRPADVWEALLSVADAAGGPWPERARVALVALVASAMGEPPSLGVKLLADLRTVFGECESLSTVDLISYLILIDESPWGDLKGKPLDARRLANLLKPYSVMSRQIRINETNSKGYTRESLWEAWTRYLPPLESALGGPPQVGATWATNATKCPEGGIGDPKALTSGGTGEPGPSSDQLQGDQAETGPLSPLGLEEVFHDED